MGLLLWSRDKQDSNFLNISVLTPPKIKVTPPGQDHGHCILKHSRSYNDRLSAKWFYSHRLIIMPKNYVSYLKHWRARQEESCDVECYCCCMTSQPQKLLVLQIYRKRMWLRYYELLPHPSYCTARLPTCSHCWRAPAWCSVKVSMTSLLRTISSYVRWTLLSDWYTEAAETMD